MKIALDATYSLGPSLSGVGVYCTRLIESLAPAAPDLRFVLCYRANRFFRAMLSPLPANTERRLFEERLSPRWTGGVALFHGLNQRLPRSRFPRMVATFHDLFALSGEYSTPDFRWRFTALAKDAAARADHIIAVSHYTAFQVEQLLGVDPSRITVIHHGVDPVPEFTIEELATCLRRYRLRRPFLLHVGAIQARKNISRLVEAFESLSPEYQLALGGSDGHGAAEIHARIVASPAQERIRVLGYVPRPDIERLYRLASALAFPSLDEGFGLPVLEAMSAGLPVVTSNRSATAEVAGEAALLVDPTDTAQIVEGLRRVLGDEILRSELVRKGLERAAQFSWTRAAAETLAVYRRLLKTDES
ncbi:MAG: glycosyltransferase family 4 protein [Acidobacteria bacterium]|nr:glycosyltransferase family 4 protein [Acidobacteriota bacterium]